MPRDSGGNYSLPSGYLAVTGETIQSSQHNPPLEDIGQALTASLPRSGVAAMLANLPMGGFKITNLGVGTAATDAARVSQLGKAAVLTKTAGYTAVLADRGALIRFTTAATLALTAAATLTADWYIDVAAIGVDVVVDPNGAELIDGASTLTIPAGSWATIYCDGIGFYAAMTRAASETAKGVIEIATGAEIAALASNLLALTPGRLKDSMAWFPITYASTIPVDHLNGPNQKVTLTGNGAFGAPSNGIPGSMLDFWIVQDATGTRIPTWNAAYDMGDYGTPVLSTGANQADIVSFKCLTASKYAFYGIRRRVD